MNEVQGNNSRMVRWNRRIKAAAVWATVATTTVYLQPVLRLDKDLVSLLIEKSALVTVVLIAGLSGTDFANAWRKR